jgi:hypothetical protein
MPGITLHFVLANRVLQRWGASAEGPPFDPDDPKARNAFYHGAIGPDFGYLPGGHRPLSELAHGVRTGALTGRLIRSARTATERAFAWGWLTHVLGDRLIHPIIGRGVGELVHGCRETFVAGAADPDSHLRVEVGVDCLYAARHADARSVRLRPAFDEVSVAFLAHAYEHTYGVTPPQRTMLASHRCAGRRAGQALSSLGLLEGLLRLDSGSRLLARIRWTLKAAGRANLLSGTSLAYLSPVRPSDWLVRAIDDAIQAHTESFMTLYRQGGTDIGDYDLDTGALLSPTGPPRAALIARMALA